MKLNIIAYFFIFLLFSSNIQCGNIIPDLMYPLLINRANIGIVSQTMTLRFSLPSGTVGINYNQFIGVQFPAASNLNLSNTNRYTCGLSDSTGKTYMVIAIAASDDTIAYCQFREPNLLNAMTSATNYILTIGFSQFTSFALTNVNQISLFTSTSNSNDKILIDYNTSFAALGLYPSYTDTTMSKMLQINDITPDRSNISLYSQFDLTVTFTVNQYINRINNMIVFKYPLGITWATSVIAVAVGSVTLNGSLNLISIGSPTDNSVYLDGVTDDLLPGTTFRLIFKSNTTGNIQLNTAPFNAMVLYKNSYSVISFDTKLPFNISPVMVNNLTINHPENWEIFDGAAWPMMISFSFDKSLPVPSYVVIQQTNTLVGIQKWNFIASTCDFSYSTSTTNITQDFGKRPICFPLRNDHNFPNVSQVTPFAGSAIVFKIPASSNTYVYNIRVFGYAENCGLNYTITGADISGRSSQFVFSVTAYNNIDMTKSNENRFLQTNMIAQGINTAMLNICYATGNGPFVDATDYAGPTVDQVLFVEIQDFRLSAINQSLILPTVYQSDISSTLYLPIIGAINNPSSSAKDLLNTGSYFSLSTSFGITAGTIRSFFALPVFGTPTPLPQQGRLTTKFSKDFLKTGSAASCFFSWGTNVISLAQSVLLSDGTTVQSAQANRISTDIPNTMDKTTTSLASPPYSIVSVNNNSNSNFTFLKDYTSTQASAQITAGFYTNCLQFNSASVGTIKSVYDYFDFQVNYQTGVSTYVTNRVNRFFKFASSLGIADDTNVYKSYNSVALTYHMVYLFSSGAVDNTAPSLRSNAICLIQISATELNNANSSNANMLSIFIDNLSLLDVDFADLSSTYPTSLNNISTYLYPSAPKAIGSYLSGLYTPAIFDTNPLATNTGSTTLLNAGLIQDTTATSTFSTYYQFLSNQLLISNVGKIANDIVIPVYCPVFNTLASFIPYFTIQWQSSKNNNHLINSAFNTMVNTVSESPYKSYFSNKYQNGVIQTITGAFPIPMNLRFQPYSSSDMYSLSLLPGQLGIKTITTPTSVFRCTGFTFLLSSRMILDSGNSNYHLFIKASYNSLIYSGTSSKYYAFGKPFSQAIFNVMTTPANIIIPSSSNNLITLIGLRRLSLDTYANLNLNSNSLQYPYNYPTQDQIAFFCASSSQMTVDQNYFTNMDTYTSLLSGLTVTYFLLDWNPDSTTAWQINAMASDKPAESLFKNDLAGNFNMILKLPLTGYIGMNNVVRITTPQFTGNTICGISNNGFTYACSVPPVFPPNNLQNIDCVNPIAGLTVNICCYNVNTGIEPFLFPLVSIYMPSDLSADNLESQQNISIYSLPTATPINWTTNNGSATDLVGGTGPAISAKFSSLTYLYTLQEGAISKGVFTIALPREAIRNMKVRIIGDFSRFSILGIMPKCTYTFSPGVTVGAMAQGDYLIDSCKVSFPVGSVVEMTTKNLIYKCGMTFSKTIQVSIWPIFATNVTTTNSGVYTITMAFNSGAGEYLSGPAGPIGLTTSGTVVNPVKPVYQPLTFCNVVSIDPLILNEIGDYTISIDVTTNAAIIPVDPITLNIPIINEIMVGFPNGLFPPQLAKSNILSCKYLNVSMQCFMIDDNMLHITLISTGPISMPYPIIIDPKNTDPTKNIIIVISGIVNVPINNWLIFFCSLNIVTAGVRTQVINGSGYIKQKLNDPVGSLGYLNVFAVTTPNNNPRALSTLSLKFTIDSSLLIPSGTVMNVKDVYVPVFAQNILNTPIFYVTLPEDYNLISLPQNILTITISENYYDPSNPSNLLQIMYSVLPPKYIGNKIKIVLNTTTLKLQNHFAFWEIIITGLVNPNDTLESPAGVKISLTNSNFSILLRTYTNLNTVVGVPVKSPIDQWLLWGRGINYVYDNAKWNIQIVTNASSNNQVVLKAGRFVKFYFRLSNLDQNPALIFNPDSKLTTMYVTIPPSTTTISLSDPTFATDLKSYNFISAIGLLSFYLGSPCGVTAGSYIINFATSNTNNFYLFAPTMVTVDGSIGTMTTTGVLLDVVKGGSQYFQVFLSEPSFSTFSLTLSQADGQTKNDPTAAVYSYPVTPMMSKMVYTFSIISGTPGFQFFKINNPNVCYALAQTTVTYNLNAENNAFPSNYNLVNKFKYYNADTDTRLKKNTIRFEFYPDIAPVFLYCGLLCTNRDFPDDNTIVNRSNSTLSYNTPTESYYSGYIPVSLGKYDIFFDNLVRGVAYKLKCVARTTLTNGFGSTSVTIVNYPPPNGSTVIKTSNLQPTYCMNFGFISGIADSVKTAMMNYCQRNFLGGIGCIICVDDGKNLVSGMQFSNNTDCTASSSAATKSRLLQATPVSTTSANSGYIFNASNVNSVYYTNPYLYDNGYGNSTSFYTICAVQDKLCAQDVIYPINMDTIMTNIIYNLRNQKGFLQTLGINNIYLNTVSLISDNSAPNITNFNLNTITSVPDSSGNFKFTITNILLININCFWKIDTSITIPNYNAVTGCGTPSRCGNIKMAAKATVIITTTTIQPFLTNTYNVWLACYNDMPNAQQVSNVIKLSTFNADSL